ncbi:hypothetical protein P3T37_000256 [Kitasatospora sp. MAA4]|uniref:hypothetical protein n=1 Tax=Kitasatospora sp. MAA4 TaxID=3035093 RepID=UPI002473B45C|nr:hypothetical protein [Kitasatospora sp. MAA4]MDH6130889.1 hypothetical protein [Kitasatospora sp. MAA4]
MRIPAPLTATLTAALFVPLALASGAQAAPAAHGTPVTRATPATHRDAFARDLSVSVQPVGPAAPGAVAPLLVTVCNHGTETPTSATLVVNGPADPSLALTAGPDDPGPSVPRSPAASWSCTARRSRPPPATPPTSRSSSATSGRPPTTRGAARWWPNSRPAPRS